MAQADWTGLTAPPAIDTTSMPRGVTYGFTRPAHSGTNNFCFAFKAADSSVGFGGYYCGVATPTAGKGGSIRAAMKKYGSVGTFAPMIGFMNGIDPSTKTGYFLGLTEGSAYQIGLAKCAPAGGFAASDSGMLRLSTQSYSTVGDSASGWFHLRLDIIVNPHDEVVLNVYYNDLTLSDVDNPSWAAISGMAQYVDDSVGILSGSLPLTTALYPVFGMYSEVQNAAVMFDQIEVLEQTSP